MQFKLIEHLTNDDKNKNDMFDDFEFFEKKIKENFRRIQRKTNNETNHSTRETANFSFRLCRQISKICQFD